MNNNNNNNNWKSIISIIEIDEKEILLSKDMKQLDKMIKERKERFLNETARLILLYEGMKDEQFEKRR